MNFHFDTFFSDSDPHPLFLKSDLRIVDFLFLLFAFLKRTGKLIPGKVDWCSSNELATEFKELADLLGFCSFLVFLLSFLISLSLEAALGVRVSSILSPLILCGSLPLLNQMFFTQFSLVLGIHWFYNHLVLIKEYSPYQPQH